MVLVRPLLQRAGLYLAMLVTMLACGDEFPFSNFPMYGKLPESVISIRVLDERGEMIPTQAAFNLGTTILKKNVVRELAELKAAGKVERVQDPGPGVMKEVGQKVLDWMVHHYPPLLPALSEAKVQLEVRRYRVVKGKIVITPEIVATARAQPLKPAAP